MSTRTDGTARVVSPQRLANFEEEDLDLDLTPPPRPRREQSPPPAPDAATDKSTPRRRRKPAQPPATAPVRPPEPPVVPAGPLAPAEPAEAQGTALKGPEQRARRSNVHIPVRLLGPIATKTETEGLSNGEIIIAAIEQTFDQLPDLIHPAPTTGGNLFDSRRSRVSRSTDGPLTPLNYGLREVDFETLDRLVTELRASSRGHLITAALSAYFTD